MFRGRLVRGAQIETEVDEKRHPFIVTITAISMVYLISWVKSQWKVQLQLWQVRIKDTKTADLSRIDNNVDNLCTRQRTSSRY